MAISKYNNQILLFCVLFVFLHKRLSMVLRERLFTGIIIMR